MASPALGICGTVRRSAIRWSTWSAYFASRRVCPAGAATTTVALAWSWASVVSANSSFCRSCAFSEGMPGIEKLSTIGSEIAPDSAAKPTSATSQAAMKTGHRR